MTGIAGWLGGLVIASPVALTITIAAGIITAVVAWFKGNEMLTEKYRQEITDDIIAQMKDAKAEYCEKFVQNITDSIGKEFLSIPEVMDKELNDKRQLTEKLKQDSEKKASERAEKIKQLDNIVRQIDIQREKLEQLEI